MFNRCTRTLTSGWVCVNSTDVFVKRGTMSAIYDVFFDTLWMIVWNCDEIFNTSFDLSTYTFMLSVSIARYLTDFKYWVNHPVWCRKMLPSSSGFLERARVLSISLSEKYWYHEDGGKVLIWMCVVRYFCTESFVIIYLTFRLFLLYIFVWAV